MKSIFSALLAFALFAASSPTHAQPAAGGLNARWNEGAKVCPPHPQPSIEVRAYDPQTYVLRENLCATFEAPFMYLLIGKTRALLIDTGDAADPDQMPLAKTVMGLLPHDGATPFPLLVVHTHRHSDHRAGDPQFQALPNAQVVGYDLASVQRYYHFIDWPNGVAQIDLGDRTVDVLPTPGHNPTHVAFYDRDTTLFFSGDFLMPARLLIDDYDADLASAKRVAAFVKDRPVAGVLGGHIELDAAGNTFDWESQYHPGEHVLPMTKADLLALPDTLSHFNGFYTKVGPFVMENMTRLLIVMAAGAGLVLIALIWALVFFIRRWTRRRRGRIVRT